MRMIRPRRSRSMPLAARLANRKVPVRLVSMTEDQSSSLIRSSRVSLVMPALATRTSTGPCASSTCVKAASTWAASVMSQRTSSAPSGAPPLRVVTATLSPWAMNASAMARPMPRLPPVTRTDRGSVGVLDPGIWLTLPDASDYRGVSGITPRPRDTRTPGTWLLVLEAEADLHADLEVLDDPVLGLSADLGDLEPVDVAQGLAGALDAVADRLVDAVGRGADDLRDAIGAVGHDAS